VLAIEETRRRKAGVGGTLGLPALMIMAAGAWFVIGPAVWPTFESGPAFRQGVSAGTAAINMIGSSLGPGVLLAIFGGMALKAGIARPAVTIDRAPAPPAPDPTLATSTVAAAGTAPAAERVAEPTATETRAGEPVVDQAASATAGTGSVVDPAAPATIGTGSVVDPAARATRAGEPVGDPATSGTRAGEPVVDPAAGETPERPE
jgi:hypothetical protein